MSFHVHHQEWSVIPHNGCGQIFRGAHPHVLGLLLAGCVNHHAPKDYKQSILHTCRGPEQANTIGKEGDQIYLQYDPKLNTATCQFHIGAEQKLARY